jgi:hypothetical protein
MNSNDFGSAVIPAMAGFFLFGKRAKVQEIQQDRPQQLPMVVGADLTGLTGVARYLISTPLVTGVTKYMRKKEKQPLTGVELYVLRQSIAEKNAPVQTSVSKYLARVTKEAPARKKTSVDKYVAKQEVAARSFSTLTGVARYEAEQDLMAKKQAAAAMIKKYLDEQEAAVISARAEAEAAYEASRNVVNEEVTQVEEPVATTRVGRYLQEQSALSKKRPAITGVARYLAKQIALDSQKPVISGVGRYLREQSVVLSKKPSPTGVARYLSNQLSAPVVNLKATLAQSGVARYLASQSVTESPRPNLSGVAKYMEKQAQLNMETASLVGQSNLLEYEATDVEVDKCLEGEFIPANDFSSATGVSRYLERQGDVVIVAKEMAKDSITGVSRYLEKQVGSVKQSLNATQTGVDRYLLNRA